MQLDPNYNPQKLCWVSLIELGKPEDELDIEFSPDNQWLDTDGWWGHPDSIKVEFKSDAKEKSKKLEEKIKSLNKDIFLWELYESDAFKFDAKHAKVLFKAIQLMQEEDSKLFIPKTLFLETLSHLKDEGLEEIRPKIRTRLTIEDYDKTIKELNSAIDFRHQSYQDQYYFFHATKQLCKAKSICKHDLKDFNFDLSSFFNSMTEIMCMDVFNPEFEGEIFDAVVNCNTITHVIVQSTPLLPEFVKRIGTFLEKTNSITSVDLVYKLNESTIGLIAGALKTNKTIRKLCFQQTDIGDGGAQIILDAIEANPNSQVTDLYLRKNKITDRFHDTLNVFSKKKNIKIHL